MVQKFSVRDLDEWDTTQVNMHIIEKNVDKFLFYHLYKFILDQLQEGFESYKSSIDFAVLTEYIKREEKLYEVLIEGKFLNF